MTIVQITPPPLSAQSMADLLCTIMVLCRGMQKNGKPYWAYLCVKPSMAKAFKEARDRGDCNIEEYGTVIEWGDGKDVPPEVQLRMKRDYGVGHDYEAQLLAAIETLERKNGFK